MMNGSPRHDDRRRRRRSHSRERSRSPRPRKSYGGPPPPAPKAYRERSRERSRSHSPMSNRRRHAVRNPRDENPSPNKCLGVFGLSLRTTERDLREVFSRYGPIEECTIVVDAQTGRPRGFAFIYFENLDDAKAAKESCNGIEIDGRRIRVDFSITQRAHTPTPGIYMGKPKYSDNRSWRGGGGSGSGGGGRRSDFRGGYQRSPSPYYRGRESRETRRPRHSRSRSFSPPGRRY